MEVEHLIPELLETVELHTRNHGLSVMPQHRAYLPLAYLERAVR